MDFHDKENLDELERIFDGPASPGTSVLLVIFEKFGIDEES